MELRAEEGQLVDRLQELSASVRRNNARVGLLHNRIQGRERDRTETNYEQAICQQHTMFATAKSVAAPSLSSVPSSRISAGTLPWGLIV